MTELTTTHTRFDMAGFLGTGDGWGVGIEVELIDTVFAVMPPLWLWLVMLSLIYLSPMPKR